MSRIPSVCKLGDRLTSTSQGLKSLSIKISNPYSSKQFELCVQVFLVALNKTFSTEMKLFIITS